MLQLDRIFNLSPIHPVSRNASPDELLPRNALIAQISRIDRESRKVCINFLKKEYPTLSRAQIRKLVSLTHENNFRFSLFEFGLLNFTGGWRDGLVEGWPNIWLLDALETGAIQYLYANGIWQVHWNVDHVVRDSSRYPPIHAASAPRVVKYLITYGPLDREQQQLCLEQGLVFYSYSSDQTTDWRQYPFPEAVDLSCGDPYLSDLKAP